MVKLQLVDSTFSHEECTVPQKVSKKLKWIRGYADGEIKLDFKIPTVFSHDFMFTSKDVLNRFEKKIGLIFESQSIIPYVYEKLDSVIPNFDIVFTHSSRLLNKFPNTRWIPGGGIWIGGQVNEKLLGGSGGEIKVYDKTKLCSIVSSNKKMCKLHEFRILAANLAKMTRPEIDIFGTIDGKWVPIIDSLKDYRFSIVVENRIDEGYFTEKILNCFATGTIPIYFGATFINDYFNGDGIINFSSAEELIDIINNISEEEYNKRLYAVKQNLDIARFNFNMIEDYIADNYFPYDLD